MTPKPKVEPPPLEKEFLEWMIDSRGMSQATVKGYRGSLRDFCRRMKIENYGTVTLQILDRYMGRLSLDGLSRATRRNRAHAVKALFRFLVRRGHVSKNPADEDFQMPRRRATEIVPVFTPEEIEALIFSFQEPVPVRQPNEPDFYHAYRVRVYQFTMARDTACLALAYSCGLRVSEPSGLELRDYDLGTKGLPMLTVREGKWSTEPVSFPLDRRVYGFLEIYLQERARFGFDSPALFPPVSGRSRPTSRGIGPQRLDNILKRRVRLAGIRAHGRRLSFHTLRYSIATHLYRDGHGLKLPDIQVFMRHLDVETTIRYLKLGTSLSMRKRAIGALPWNVRRAFGRSSAPLDPDGNQENPKRGSDGQDSTTPRV